MPNARRKFLRSAAFAAVAGAAVLVFVILAAPALAHDATFHAYEAARDHAEARLLAAGGALGAVSTPLPANTPVCQLTIKVLDEKTQRPVSGLVLGLAHANPQGGRCGP